MKGIDPEVVGYINEVYDLEAIACNLSIEKEDEGNNAEEPFIQDLYTYRLATNY